VIEHEISVARLESMNKLKHDPGTKIMKKGMEGSQFAHPLDG
jgi:hypothetical protein